MHVDHIFQEFIIYVCRKICTQCETTYIIVRDKFFCDTSFQVIGALTSVLLIWVVTGILFYLAIERIVHKDFELDATVMLITSAIGVVVNLVLVILH